jgi:hypothetical protein
MKMRHFATLLVVTAAIAASAGCNRQDADALARIGDLLTQKAKSLRAQSEQTRMIPRYLDANGNNRAEQETDASK